MSGTIYLLDRLRGWQVWDGYIIYAGWEEWTPVHGTMALLIALRRTMERTGTSFGAGILTGLIERSTLSTLPMEV